MKRAACRWTLSSRSLSFFRYGSQIDAPYSRVVSIPNERDIGKSSALRRAVLQMLLQEAKCWPSPLANVGDVSPISDLLILLHQGRGFGQRASVFPYQVCRNRKTWF